MSHYDDNEISEALAKDDPGSVCDYITWTGYDTSGVAETAGKQAVNAAEVAGRILFRLYKKGLLTQEEATAILRGY